MYLIEKEIRDFLQAQFEDGDRILDGETIDIGGETVSVFAAQPRNASIIIIQPKTNTSDVSDCNVTITGTDTFGNSITDILTFDANDSIARYSAKYFVTVTSIVWTAQDGGTSTWDVGISKYRKYYTGKVKTEKIPSNYLPCLMVYGDNTSLVTDRITTNRDVWTHEINIEIVTNVFGSTSETGPNATETLMAQKLIKDLVFEADSDGTPKPDTLVRVLRNNIKGTNYLFNNDLSIDYENENISGTQYFHGILKLSATTKLTNRS